MRLVITVCFGLIMMGCTADAPNEPNDPPDETLTWAMDLEAVTPLNLETFDGSGQVVHPDWTPTPTFWGGGNYRHHLAITPYPNGDISKENPSLFVSNDGIKWIVPDSVVNPVVRPSTGYLSDPDQLYNPKTGELWLYYRHVTQRNEIFLMRSRTGVTWSQPVLVASAPNHSLVSPSVVRRGPENWLMWSVNGGRDGCQGDSATVELRSSKDGIAWSSPKTVSLYHNGIFPWHIEVQWIPSRSEYWALYNGKERGSCNTAALYLATSKDGINWITFRNPVLTRGVIPEFRDVVYRSTFAYHRGSDEITFWYSGASFESGAYVWKSATQRRNRAELFAQLAASGIQISANLTVPPHTTYIPPLTNQTAP